MNGKDLLMGLGHVDEVYIQAAEEKTLRKPFGTALIRAAPLGPRRPDQLLSPLTSASRLSSPRRK